VPDPLRPVNDFNPDVSPSPQLAQTLARALALEPSQRFATAAEMRSQLVFPPTHQHTIQPSHHLGEGADDPPLRLRRRF
jgi:hypothetical protein